MKTYGRKTESTSLKDIVDDIRILQKTVNQLRNHDLVPKGVFRFNSFTEADEWMTDQMIKNHVRHNLKT